MEALTVKSKAFEHGKQIPPKYTCDQTGTSPPLSISGVPKTSKSLTLIMDDPDAPSGTFVHWIIWNIPPQTSEINEDTAPGVEGLNSGGEIGYTPPCPPYGTHRYVFKIYALDCELALSKKSNKQDLEAALQGHVIAKAELLGLYSR
ncbi:MAG: YbhB/YbcL family Raf kinase inhibitor-like protein [Candidatus Bathyarchaeota archaeon]|nr:YbhB/YbcL family Raf kinase inhibitor-like protein [Candidatus Bathyarchaeota archaeon]